MKGKSCVIVKTNGEFITILKEANNNGWVKKSRRK